MEKKVTFKILIKKGTLDAKGNFVWIWNSLFILLFVAKSASSDLVPCIYCFLLKQFYKSFLCAKVFYIILLLQSYKQ